ncbi:MAG: hypothetical protein GY824_26590 [Delftia sp.]|nr:hypothetical protein [Delftia sp.]
MLLRLKWAFRRQVQERIQALPSPDDRRSRLCMELFRHLRAAAYFASEDFYSLIVAANGLEMVRQSRFPCDTVAAVAILLGSRLGDHAAAERLALAALGPNRSKDSGRRGRALLSTQLWVLCWVEPLGRCFARFREAHEQARDEGEAEWAGYALAAIAEHGLCLGTHLETIAANAQRAAWHFARVGIPVSARAQRHLARYCRGLSGGEGFDPDGKDPLAVLSFTGSTQRGYVTRWQQQLFNSRNKK